MGKPRANKSINGSFGRVWMNEHLFATSKSFEAKLKLDWEAVTFPEELGEDYKYMGYSLSGTMTLTKIDSHILHLYSEGVQSGVIPEINCVARLNDPASYGAERVALYGIVFDEVTLMKFENKKIVEEEVPFKARSYKYLDLMPEGVV